MLDNNKQTAHVEDVLYAKDKGKYNSYSKHSSDDSKHSKTEGQSNGNTNRCFRCGKSGYIKRDCRAKVVCHRCGRPGHIRPNCQIIDSGCSHHATGNSLLSEVRTHHGRRVIATADNSLHPVVEEGRVNVENDAPNIGGISLEDVYHVPGLKKNLVSVSQITDSGRYVLFSPDGVKIVSNIK
ncbi:serine/arginine-rich splicing factor RS2Z32-like [Momordica charantia]|uniref:Serine/arginine-rich splicing factor RS2Z32-like n=1 Tax=Momordica charantia TaxID=3673 RepID=A0A6J1DTX9_MOMCH|nr:serine/arginine-rich splicing factor RS2Z32-like [Momordica charantia]